MALKISLNSDQYGVCHLQLQDVCALPGSDDKVRRVYFIRHGESALNVAQKGVKYVQGQSPSVKLTAKGSEQACLLADALVPKMKGLRTFIATSTARRAIDTAKPLLQRLSHAALACPEFLELGSGKWEGVSKDDPDYVKDNKVWKNLSAKEKLSAPKVSTGESYYSVAQRALGCLSELLAGRKADETVFVFSHSMTMNAIALSLTGIDLSEEVGTSLPEFDIENGDILSIEIPQGSSVRQGQVKAVIHSNANGGLNLVHLDKDAGKQEHSV